MMLSDKYLWIKIPRTGTYAYRKLFSDYNEEIRNSDHYHYSYIRAVERYGKVPGVSVVRHPLKRFISSLKYIVKSKQDCLSGNCRFNREVGCSYHNVYTDFLSSTNNCVEFLNTHFTKNCQVKSLGKHKKFTKWTPSDMFKTEYVGPLTDVFKTEYAGFVRLFFQTQTEYVYHPNVKIFKHENIDEFSRWIESELGYDMSKLENINSSRDIELNIDTNNPEFIKTVEMLFHIDYQIFDYPLQYS